MVKQDHRHVLVAGAWLLLCAPLLWAADITMRTDRDTVGLSESFQVMFESSGRVDADPDFAPLERDFQVISTSQSSRLSIVNGKTSSTKTWTLTLLARRTGRLDIPSIAFGRDRSPAGHVEVTLNATAPGPSDDAESNEVYLEVEARPLEPYVQQQILYKARLFRAYPTANASLSEPKVEAGNAIIERIGEDSVYETRVNGRPYQVVERRYAVYPQTSGVLKIGPLMFRARSGGPFNIFDPLGSRAESIVRQSAPVELKVRAKPDVAAGGTWLPARDLLLTSTWSREPPEFRVGTPITRTVKITAAGLTASQLPELPAPAPAGFKIYPDQPELVDDRTADGVTGTRVEKVAVIPSRPGSYELPAIRVPWWNTKTDRLEHAELPAQRIVVLPAEGGSGMAGSGTEVPAPEASIRQGPDTGGLADGAPGPAVTVDRRWQWISLALAMSWLGTLAAWWWSRRPRHAVAHPGAAHIAAARGDVERACGRNDAAAAKDALLVWATLRWPEAPPRNLGDMAMRCGDELAARLRELDAALYGPAAGAWIGAPLRQAFRAGGSGIAAANPGSAGELQPLHRIGD